MTKIRWFILILGPLPIFGTSWAVSSWFRPQPRAIAARNDAIVDASHGRAAAETRRDIPRAAGNEGLRQACRRTAQRLSQRVGAGIAVIQHAPFVIGGDLSEDRLQVCHTNTIAPAVRAMQQRYFRSRPHEPITVLLFRGEASYNRYARKLFNDEAISVYGYYKPSVRTLIMNISTGNGTLLHELTHALMDFEMRDVPIWINEGLASLHEQCRFRTDQRGPWIEGLANWRLEGLQTVIRQGRLRSLADLIEDEDFRGPLVGTNYAQARYFCMYLQKRGALESFFQDFRAHRKQDPSGRAAAVRALGGRSWAEIDRDFRRFALALSE